MTQPRGGPILDPPPPPGAEEPSYDQKAIADEIWQAIADLTKQQADQNTNPQPDEEPEGPQPVNLYNLMSGEPAGEEWVTEPLLPAGKLVALVSKRGDGKSLLMLDVACAVATGQATLHQPEGDPKHVLYLDMEMGPDDLYDRLSDLSYTTDHPLFSKLADNLHYYQLPSLPPLDTEQGGEALEGLVDTHDAELVVIDTISRVVTGDENAAEPYRDLYRNTEIRLKRRRVTLARLDHLGKDPGKGSRGSSAKEDPMDVVWQMAVAASGQLVFTLTKGRQGWIPRSVTVTRVELLNGSIKHTILEEPDPDWLKPLIVKMDKLKIDPKLSGNAAFIALRDAGEGVRRSKVMLAVRHRRSGTGTTPQKKGGTTTGNQAVPLTQTLIDTDEKAVPPPGTKGNWVVPGSVPPKGRNHRKPDILEEEISSFADDSDDYEPDPDDLPDPY